MSSGVFWGAIIILFGISILLREVLHIHIPLTRILFGILLLYIGIRVIAGGFGRSTEGHQNTVFGRAQTQYHPGQNEYSIIFGSGVVDLSHLNSVIQDERIEVNVIFGSGVVRINDSLPIEIKGTAAFGSVVLPNQNSAGLGEVFYHSAAYSQGQPHITIQANAVFGKLAIEKVNW